MKKKKKFVGGFDDLKKDKDGDGDTDGGVLFWRWFLFLFFFLHLNCFLNWYFNSFFLREGGDGIGYSGSSHARVGDE